MKVDSWGFKNFKPTKGNIMFLASKIVSSTTKSLCKVIQQMSPDSFYIHSQEIIHNV